MLRNVRPIRLFSCPTCNKEISTIVRSQKFCSVSCQVKSRAGKKRLRLKPMKPFTEEHKRKIGLANKGKKREPFSPEWIAKLKATRQKERNGNWKGGRTKEVFLARTSQQYKNWRFSVFERDLFTCRNCGIKGVFLEAHHILSFAKYKESRYDLDNGLTLCQPCHYKTDNHGRKTNK